jgi:hypothetical protein
MPKTEILTHKDMLGRDVAVGDTIAYTQYNCIYIGRVSKLTAKRVTAHRFGIQSWSTQQMPGTFLKLEDPAVTAWILKGAKTKWDIVYGR